MAVRKRDSNDSSDSRIASLKLRDKEFNELYLKWRIEHKNDYGFYFPGSTDEITYRDGEGFITETPQAAERSAVVSIHSVLAKFLILYTLLRILMWLLSVMAPSLGIHLRLLHDSPDRYIDNELATLMISGVLAVVTRLLPLLYLLNKVKMPRKIFLNFKVYNKPMFRQAVPMAMLTFAIGSVMHIAADLASALLGVSSEIEVWMPRSKLCFFVSALFYIVIVPVTSEIIHHGIILQILKQFGDGYSLVVSSIIAALTMDNTHSFLFTFLYMFVIGYFFVRSGSILTAFVMRITISASIYAMAYADSFIIPDGRKMTVIIGILLLYFAVGITSVIIFIVKHSNKISLPMYDMYLSEKDRIMSCLTIPSVIIWLSLTAAYIILCLKPV